MGAFCPQHPANLTAKKPEDKLHDGHLANQCPNMNKTLRRVITGGSGRILLPWVPNLQGFQRAVHKSKTDCPARLMTQLSWSSKISSGSGCLNYSLRFPLKLPPKNGPHVRTNPFLRRFNLLANQTPPPCQRRASFSLHLYPAKNRRGKSWNKQRESASASWAGFTAKGPNQPPATNGSASVSLKIQ